MNRSRRKTFSLQHRWAPGHLFEIRKEAFRRREISLKEAEDIPIGKSAARTDYPPVWYKLLASLAP
jgi:hypothetical protein